MRSRWMAAPARSISCGARDTAHSQALRSRSVRFWLTAGGIGVTALLVMVLGSAYHSVSSSVAAYVGQPGIDVWVAPLGVDNLMRSSAFLPAHVPESLATIRGVAAADPIVRAYVTVRDEADPSPAGHRLALIAIGRSEEHTSELQSRY